MPVPPAPEAAARLDAEADELEAQAEKLLIAADARREAAKILRLGEASTEAKRRHTVENRAMVDSHRLAISETRMGARAKAPFAAALRKKGMSLREAAEKIGVSPGHLSHVASGRKLASRDLLDRIEVVTGYRIKSTR